MLANGFSPGAIFIKSIFKASDVRFAVNIEQRQHSSQLAAIPFVASEQPKLPPAAA
jgi:hypothetical protein